MEQELCHFSDSMLSHEIPILTASLRKKAPEANQVYFRRNKLSRGNLRMPAANPSLAALCWTFGHCLARSKGIGLSANSATSSSGELLGPFCLAASRSNATTRLAACRGPDAETIDNLFWRLAPYLVLYQDLRCTIGSGLIAPY